MIPSFFKKANAKFDYEPNLPAVIEEAAKTKAKPIGSDKTKVQLLIIDMQRDFCYPEGSLYVGGTSGRGAVEDQVRIAEFIYANLENISETICTLDSHKAFQIFYGQFWHDQNDQPLPAHTIVTADDVKSGKYKPNPSVATWLCNGNYAWLVKQVIHYCEQLEKNNKYQLYLWPFHCMMGSKGHNMVGILEEAVNYHGVARGQQPGNLVKGMNPLTENYSVFGPEVTTRWDGQPLVQRDVLILDRLAKADYTIICGEAGSHCVKSSIDDILTEIQKEPNAKQLADKIYIMEDCMSPVVIPGVVDFSKQQNESLDRYRNAGMHVVKSTDPLASWQGLKI